MKIYICGDKDNGPRFSDAESLVRKHGHIPVNPVKVIYALPKEISNADFTLIAYELIRICDAVYVLDGADKCLFARMELAHARMLGKAFMEWEGVPTVQTKLQLK